MENPADIVRHSRRKTRVLFLAWGFSIHAKRRIQVFVDDSSFEVAVASTFNYGFENGKNILLAGAWEGKQTPTQSPTTGRALKRRWRNGKSLIYSIPILLSPVFLAAADLWLRNWRVFKTFLFSAQISDEKGSCIRDFRILKAAVKEFSPDVIFLQTLLYPSYLAFFLPPAIPIVITFWNGDITWWAQWNGIERLLKKELVTYGVRRAKAVTVNSRSAFDACLGYGPSGDKIHRIPYPGVEPGLFKPIAKEKAREKLAINSTKVVLCPRGLGGYLNSDVIVEAAAKVIKRYGDVQFIFLSGGEYEMELKRHQIMAQQMGISNNIEWAGHVPWEDMPLYYNAADVMVSVSSKDSLPNCMIEAMACGTSLIMGDIPQIREWIVDGVNGYLVHPRDSIGLSQKITRAIREDGGSKESAIKRNLEIVRREFDLRKNARTVKRLVHTVGLS